MFMTWYNKYLSVFEKPFSAVPESTIQEIRNKLEKIQSGQPLVSVVLIAHNEESRLLSCIWSLAENRCAYPIEIIAVNNHSTDRTSEVLNAVGIKWFYEEKKSPGHARACGLMHANGKFHLCIDSDTMYPPDYIQVMTDELKKDGVAAVNALWSFVPDQNHSRLGLKLYELLRDIHLRLLFRKRPEACARGMVFGFYTEQAREVGFRVNIIRGEDGAMASGLKKYGKIKLVTDRKARVVTGLGTLNADGPLLNSFWKKLKKALKGFAKYFTTREEYKDQESNLIKKE